MWKLLRCFFSNFTSESTWHTWLIMITVEKATLVVLIECRWRYYVGESFIVAWHVLHQKQSSQEFYFSLFWTFSKLFCLLWFVFSRVSFCCILELQKWKMCKLWMRFPKSASEVQNCVQYWLRLIRPRNLRANSIISNFKRDVLLI